jgi:hypothetical protein
LAIFRFFRIKYPDEKKCIDHINLLGIDYEAWLICDNEDASKKNTATEILAFDFELFIGVLFQNPGIG